MDCPFDSQLFINVLLKSHHRNQPSSQLRSLSKYYLSTTNIEFSLSSSYSDQKHIFQQIHPILHMFFTILEHSSTRIIPKIIESDTKDVIEEERRFWIDSSNENINLKNFHFNNFAFQRNNINLQINHHIYWFEQ